MSRKKHLPDLLGEWARENGFDYLASAYHPQEVEKRRQQAVKKYNDRVRKEEERKLKRVN
jgi:hypothetical protein